MILKPDLNLKNIFELDTQTLKNMGIKALFLDLDSTVMVSKSGIFCEKMMNWFEEMRKEFYIAIVTNNKNPDYLKCVKNAIDFKVIENASKPSTKKMKILIKQLFMKPEEVVMIGDRPLTDILVGKLCKTKTILVGSINENENALTKFVRKLERLTICPT